MKMKTRQGIGDLETPDKKIVSTDKEKALLLCQQFNSVFTEEVSTQSLSADHVLLNSHLSNITITAKQVNEILKNLKVTKAAGPDNIHPRLLKESSEVITRPLEIIFNKSVQQGAIPNAWKISNIVPVYKKGIKSNPSNYRPIALTSVPCKILETIVRNHIIEHAITNNLFDNRQHGFITGRSCFTNLLHTLDSWTKLLDDGQDFDTVYLDISKAFDTVPHERLLHKLSNYGIKDPLLSWIRSFLTKRKQRVVVGGENSQWSDVISGVPQGSVLGPILFILYINDMPSSVKTSIALFADDAKLYSPCYNFNLLQADLDSLSLWSRKWQLTFNPCKSKVMHVGRTNQRIQYSLLDTAGERHSLSHSDLEKDLGIYVDDMLSFDHHIETTVKKANNVVGLVRRTFVFLDEKTFCLIFKAVIRPLLEYCNSIWHPHLSRHVKEIESVQRRATKLIPSLKHLSYSERLRKLKLPSLQFRQLRGDMIETYKIISHKYDINPSTFFSLSASTTRGHSFKLTKLRSNSSIRLHFFTNRVINSWNSLTEEIVTSPTTNTFKNRLDKFWESHPLLYDAHSF